MYLDSRPEGSVSCDIDVSPEQLWPLISDITIPAQFSDELQQAEWLEGATPAVGSRFLGRNASPQGYNWETTPVVTACDEPTIFEWTIGEPDQPMAIWSFEVAPAPHGATLTHRVIFGPGSGPLRSAVEKDPERAEAIVSGRIAQMRDSMQRVIDGIKTLAQELG